MRAPPGMAREGPWGKGENCRRIEPAGMIGSRPGERDGS